MVYDKSIAALFLLNFKEAYRSAKLLALSHQRISHDYPDSDEQRAEALNIAYNHTLQLISTLDSVKAYVENHLKIPMKHFSFLKGEMR